MIERDPADEEGRDSRDLLADGGGREPRDLLADRAIDEDGGPGIEVVETPDIEEAIREREGKPLPQALPVLPLKATVTFPDTLTPLAVGQPRSIKLVDDVLSGERTLVMVASRDPEADEPGPDQLYDVGVVGVIARMMKVPDGTARVLVQGTERVRIEDYVAEEPYLVARISPLPDVVEPSPELEALRRNVQNTFSTIIEGIPYLPEELQLAVANVDDPPARCGSRPRRSRSCSRRSTWRSGCGGCPRSSPASSRWSSSARGSSLRSSRRWRRVSASTSCASS
jgi:Lon protease-like protein